LDKDLSPYAAIMLLNTPTEELNAAERAHFETYIENGGNAVVVHRAAITLPAGSWPWYEKFVGRTVGTHPMLQTGVVNVVDKKFPAAFGLPEHWIWSDEFYPLSNPYNISITPVLTVDEASYDPAKIWPGQKTEGMGKDHPEAWYHRVGKGRVFVTALGHSVEMYRDPRYLDHLMGAIYWAATGKGVQK
jgi:type 1 glutamine amidotransferase